MIVFEGAFDDGGVSLGSHSDGEKRDGNLSFSEEIEYPPDSDA